MHIPSQSHSAKIERTDIWREGKWLDMWSVVHFLTGISIGLGLYYLNFSALSAVSLTLVSLIAYEMFEVIAQIEEMPTNRFMDVVVGMVSFLPTFFFVAPAIPRSTFILAFACILGINLVMSATGWYASQKAAALETRMRDFYAQERTRLLARKEKLKRRFGRQ